LSKKSSDAQAKSRSCLKEEVAATIKAAVVVADRDKELTD
jgi:hypothetical protein